MSYDYTVDTPTFYWSRVFVPGADPRIEASRYRIEVDDDVNFIGSPNWTYETQNLSATPTDGAPFVPISATVYYWRVTPLAESGAVLTTSTHESALGRAHRYVSIACADNRHFTYASTPAAGRENHGHAALV